MSARGAVVLSLLLAACAVASQAPADPSGSAPGTRANDDARGTTPGASPGAAGTRAAATAGTAPGRQATDRPDDRQRQAEACVQKAFGGLSPARRAGQLLMIGVPADSPARHRSLVRDLGPGGVFLAGRSTTGPARIRTQLGRLPPVRVAGTRIGPLTAVDQEGGAVQTFRGRRWTAIPSARSQGRWSRDRLAARTREWAGELERAGVTMNLGPVADIVPAGTESANPPIGHFGRHYGTSVTTSSRGVATVSTSLRDAGVIPTVKHFPGLGRVRANTDFSATAVDRTTSADSPSLAPFRAGIDAGAGAVMISSARYPRIDAERLAVFSPAVITDLLRERMGYDGVVMTDDVGAAAAVRSVPARQRATRFIAAGGDLVLTVDPALARTMADAIADRSRTSAVFRSRTDASVRRVLRLKHQAGLLRCE